MLVVLASAFVLLSLVTTLGSQPGTYVGDARLEHVTEPGQYLARHAHLWDDARGIGKPISHFSFSPAPAALQAGLAALGAQPWLIQRLTHALFLSLAALGVIVLMREFIPRVGIAHATAAFAYTFSPIASQLLLPSNLFLFYALVPWFAWIALRGVRDRDPWRWAAAFALALAAVGPLNLANLGFALVPAALTALYFSLYERLGLSRLWGWVWRSGVLGMLTCSAAVVVLWLSAPEASSNLRLTELPEQVAQTSSWFESWRGLGYWQTYPGFFGLSRSNVLPYFTDPVVIVASFVAAIGALVALALGRSRHRILFGAMLLVSLVLMVGIYGSDGRSPFGELLSFSFDHSEFARGFRTTYKAGAGFMLAVAALIGLGVASAVGRLARGRGKPVPPRLAPARNRWLLLGLVVLGGGLAISSFPFSTGRLYPEDSGFRNIPQYWQRTFEYLDAQEQPGRILVLPAPERGRYRWGDVHDNLFDGFSPLSPLMNNLIPQGTAESGDLVSAIDEYVASTGYVKGTLGPILARLGVRWVLLQNDLDWQSGLVPRPSTYDALRADPDLRRAATFGRRGQNTFARGDLEADFSGERSLSPVEIYKVAGAPSPRPRLVAGPPLLVVGGGDSWPSLATAGLLDGPPVAYTGAAEDDVLRQMVASRAEIVMTDGNRRRTTAATIGRPSRSPTLAAQEPTDQAQLFTGRETQSVATYADARRIYATQSGAEVGGGAAESRPANAFDRVERTAWKTRETEDPTGEALSVELREPEAITAVSVLPYAEGDRVVKAVDVIARSGDGEETRERLRFRPARHRLPVARMEATDATSVEFRIARVLGRVGSVGITEAAVGTPNGQLDLREFVRTPIDLAVQAASDERLRAALAARPPRYELRRVTGVAASDEETELRREITAFGDHRYRLSLTASIDDRAADSAIDGLLGAPVGAVATSRFTGDPANRGGLVVDDDLSTAWEPDFTRGPRVDLRFPATEVRTVEVLVASGRRGGSRVSDVRVAIGDDGMTTADSSLPRRRHCARPRRATGSCLESHIVHVPPTDADELSVTLAGIEPVFRAFGRVPPKVVEVRINGRKWSQLGDPGARDTCAPLVALDGRAVSVQLPRDPHDVVAGRLLELRGCEPVRLGPGRHRIETLPGLSGAVRTVSLVPRGETRDARDLDRGPRAPGTVDLVDRSPTRLRLRVDAPEDALLVGGMPAHQGWAADEDQLRRYRVPLDTFAAWTVEERTAGAVALQFEPQQIYELAIALSIAASAWCVWRVTRRRRGWSP